ncbi:MAG: LamG-like jellyroll fold domain-containing protein, partial [Bacteroidota bacterium]
IKSTSSFGTQSLLSKRADCGEDNALAISYTPSSNFLNVLVSEDSGKKVGINEQLSFDDCWHHVVLVRDGGRVTLYVNGTEMGDGSTNSRIDLTSSGTLTFGNGPCTNTTENPFSGLIDELRIYSRPLTRTEIEDLYLLPDRIGNRDTLIFLGGEVPAFVPNTCADNFMWSPAATASDPDSRNPILTPTETTTYTLQASDAICNAIDTLRVTVVDPSELDCNQTFVPNAFTPNGDGRNEIFKISNPFAIDLISFEIYDRQGGRVFATESAFEGWNGVFKGQDMNPGVLLYRIRFRCNGEEEVSFGSFTLIR